MKIKPLAIMFLLFSLCSCDNKLNLSSSSSSTDNNTSSSEVIFTEEEKAQKLWKKTYSDSENGFNGIEDIKRTQYYFNGESIEDFNMQIGFNNDAKYIFYSQDKARIVNVSEGYAITVADTEFEVDYSLSEYRSKYHFDDGVLTISYQDKSPYGNTINGWNIYLTEWINRFISNPSFLQANNLSYLRENIKSSDIILGYEVIQYDVVINDNQGIEFPYYHIAIARPEGNYTAFFLISYKSKTNNYIYFDSILKSFKAVASVGRPKNHVGQYEVIVPEYWNEETKKYYNKLLQLQTTDWGFFSASMVDNTQNDYDYQYSRIQNEKNRLEEALDYQYGIMPTYTHIAYGSNYHYFPSEMAKEFAGGNGFNNKPVLQFTYQFTTLNNTNLDGYTPMFDILRGTYDEHFHKLAKAIKEYEHPVLFRLNNEMNTDWTSYAGIVTLLDPDIFIETWKRLYNIFLEEGVDNAIWIFNPIAITCPYCNWGEHLNFMPGPEYVQMLGLTHYEMGNSTPIPSFKEGYENLYNKNKDYFINYPWIISEFACGSGGETTGVAKRNASLQAEWVKDMFDCLINRNEEEYAFVKNIVGIVWFSTNDYVDGKVSNYLALDSDLTETLNALKEGIKQTTK